VLGSFAEPSLPAGSRAGALGAEATAAAANTVDRTLTGAARVPPKPGLVWVDTNTKLYHKVGDPSYGATKKGKWLTEKDAIKRGYRAVLPSVTIGQ
jgi:hypothetical protein